MSFVEIDLSEPKIYEKSAHSFNNGSFKKSLSDIVKRMKN
jgi:hypothetical protein